jgi:hypothetical protein
LGAGIRQPWRRRRRPGHLQHTGIGDGARKGTDDNPKVTNPAAVAKKIVVARKSVVVAKAKPAAAAAHCSNGGAHRSSGTEDSATHRSSGVHHAAGTDDSSVVSRYQIPRCPHRCHFIPDRYHCGRTGLFVSKGSRA